MFDSLMTRMIRTGRLTVIYPDGAVKTYGTIDSKNSSLNATMRLHRKDTAGKILANPYLAFGEASMDGDLTVEGGTLWDLLEVIGRNLNNLPAPPPWLKLWHRVVQAFETHNTLAASRRNVAHHYDLSDEMYRAFLDSDRQYSCAYFPHPGLSLEEAQVAKKRHLIAKLDLQLQPGRFRLRLRTTGFQSENILWGDPDGKNANASERHISGVGLQANIARMRI